jgi:hypothetical protein
MRAQTEALRLAVSRPDEMLPLLHEALFTDERHLGVLRALNEAGGDLHRATAEADPIVADRLTRLAVQESDAEPGEVRRLLLSEAATRVANDLEREARTAEDTAAYSVAHTWLRNQIEALTPDAPPDRQAEDELLDWLTHRVEEQP